jgi:hypothetical protein
LQIVSPDFGHAASSFSSEETFPAVFPALKNVLNESIDLVEHP